MNGGQNETEGRAQEEKKNMVTIQPLNHFNHSSLYSNLNIDTLMSRRLEYALHNSFTGHIEKQVRMSNPSNIHVFKDPEPVPESLPVPRTPPRPVSF